MSEIYRLHTSGTLIIIIHKNEKDFYLYISVGSPIETLADMQIHLTKNELKEIAEKILKIVS